jgi:hypothetical protein
VRNIIELDFQEIPLTMNQPTRNSESIFPTVFTIFLTGNFLLTSLHIRLLASTKQCTSAWTNYKSWSLILLTGVQKLLPEDAFFDQITEH